MKRNRDKWAVPKLLFLFLLVASTLWMFRAPFTDMFRGRLLKAEQGYVLLVPCVVFYLVWLRRSRFQYLSLEGSLFGFGLVVLGAFFADQCDKNGILIGWHLGAIVVLVGCLVTMLGLPLIRNFGPALLALALVVPVPGSVRQGIALPLQQLATSVTAQILGFIGIDAIQKGTLIEINGIDVAVGEACNGMRLLVPLGLVVYGFVFSLPLRMPARFFLICASVPIALVSNVFRLIPTSIAYGYLPSWAAAVHDVSGWLMIPMSLILLLAVIRFLQWLDVPVTRWRLVTA